MPRRRILILGASYGLLPGVKLALAGHEVTFVCRAQEAQQLASDDLIVRIPLRCSAKAAQLRTRAAQFCTPNEADPETAELVILAMQEPQLAAPEVSGLLRRIARSARPCLSLMNLPPPAFLKRLGVDGAALEEVYCSADAWAEFDPGKCSNASPDPQALRMTPDLPGELTVTLASNFKAAPFANAADQSLLTEIARDLSRVKVDVDGSAIAPPVRMLAHSSLHIPLAKWPMLIAGNSRCLTHDSICTIAEAIHTDLAASQRIYEQVVEIIRALGTPADIVVPFDQYQKAAALLVRPSSAARAIASGAPNVERIDRLVLNLAAANGLASDALAQIHEVIETRLMANRR